jgi:hypothetical protein
LCISEITVNEKKAVAIRLEPLSHKFKGRGVSVKTDHGGTGGVLQQGFGMPARADRHV